MDRRLRIPVLLVVCVGVVVFALLVWSQSDRVDDSYEPRVARNAPPLPDEPPPLPPRPSTVAPIAPDPVVVAEAVPNEPPPPLPRIELLVRDMANGEPVPYVGLRVGDEVVSTDLAGRAVIASKSAGPVTMEKREPWSLVCGEIRGGSSAPVTLWVYTDMEVRGRVRHVSSVARLRIESVRLYGAVGPRPKEAEWARELPAAVENQQRFAWQNMAEVIEADGTFVVRVPRIVGYQLCARAQGWEPCTVSLRLDPIQSVVFELRKRSLRVSGVLRDASGNPIADAGVCAFILLDIPISEVDRAAFRATGHAYSMVTYPKTGRAKVCFDVSTRTGADGSFLLRPNVKGELRILARPRGDYRPVFVKSRKLEEDIGGLTLTAQPGDGRMVRILESGVPFSGKICFTDLSRKEQPSSGFDLREKNEFPMSRLVPGHQYVISVHQRMGFRRYFVWKESEVIELERLSRKYVEGVAVE